MVAFDVSAHARELETFLQKPVDSLELARKVLLVLRKLVAHSRWGSRDELSSLLTSCGRALIRAASSESVVCSLVCRVLTLVREEHHSALGQEQTQQDAGSLHTLLTTHPADAERALSSHDLKLLRERTIEALSEYMAELETSRELVANQALEHIHSNEIIMTQGNSSTVSDFLLAVAKKRRRFTVMVAEGSPACDGHDLATKLAKAGVETTVIPNAAIFAVMARVNKVIIGTNAIFADGGLKAAAGCHGLALAARYHSVPLIVCSPLFKLSPLYTRAMDQPAHNKFLSPQPVVGSYDSAVSSYNPVFDFIPAELVTLIVTDVGGNAPSYIYRLSSDLFASEDVDVLLSESTD